MKALGNILGLLALGLLLLLVGLGFYVTQLLDPNDYKAQIRQLAREQLGLELNIDGDIGWSLFPWLGLRLHDTSLASVRTPERPVASVRRLDVALQVIPLLRHQEIWMRRIDVDGLELTLSRDDRGLANWEGIGQPLAPPPVPAGEALMTKTGAVSALAEEVLQAPPVPSATLDSLNPRPRLMIESLSLTDASISYQDLRTGRQFSATHLALNTGSIREGQAVPLNMKALLSLSPQVQMQADVQGSLHFDLSARRYQWEGLRLVGELSGPALNGLTADVGLQGELALDLANNGLLEGRGFKLSLNQWRALSEWRVQPLSQDPVLSGTLSVARMDPLVLMEALGQTPPNFPMRSALRALELVTRFTLNTERLQLDDLDLGLDGTRLQGSAVWALAERPKLDLQLKGDRWVLDRYWALTGHDTRSSGAPKIAADSPLPELPSQSFWSAESLPLAELRRFDARLHLELAQLVAAQAPLEGVNLKAHLQQGLLKLDDLTANLQGAPVQVSAHLDLHSERPTFSAQASLKAVPVEQLLLSQQPDIPVQGLLNLNADLHGSGTSPQAWAESLAGTLEFNLDKGLLRQSLLEPWLCQGSNVANRKGVPSILSGWDLPLRSLQGSVQVKQGVASSSDLRLASPGLHIRGQGALDTRVMGMDYRLVLSPLAERRELPDPSCAQSRRPVSLHCRGPVLLGSRSCRLAESLN